MYRAVHGIAAILEPRDVRSLAGMTLRAADGMSPTDACGTLYTICLCADSEVRRVRISACPDGSVWCRAAGNDAADIPGVALDRDRFSEFSAKWRASLATLAAIDRGDPDEAAILQLEGPRCFASACRLDRGTISERFLRGRSSRLDPADRVLEIERLRVRLPKGYSPRARAGLVVWVDAGDSGEPPSCMSAVLDASNIIAAGFDRCGNTRPAANRYQLALDAVATVSRRYHVDPRRVYISGISGGARIASTMVACFPDVFAGAIPIVGLSCFEPVPVGNGRSAAPAYARPQGRIIDLLRERRVAAITGGRDFNQPEITGAAQILRAAGVPVRIFDHMDMGHELPTPERFAEALEWIDEPHRVRLTAEQERGERELKAAVTRIGDGGAPRNDADRALLMRVTEVAPWTAAAWRAIDLLDGEPDAE